MQAGYAIQITGLQVGYGRQVVLPCLNVAIPRGRIVGVLGPSGSGKTTLVKAIMGITPFQAGSVTVFGQPVPSLSAMAAIGYMAQNDALYDDLTATDHLLFYARLSGMRTAAARVRAKELLNFVGLDKETGKSIRDFSGGMRRRLSLAIALVNHPPLLMLDEPTVGIDPVLRRKFWDEFTALKASGCTLLATTHVMDEAARCDRLLMIREGRLIADGSVSELLSLSGTATLEDAFLHFSGEAAKECD